MAATRQPGHTIITASIPTDLAKRAKAYAALHGKRVQDVYSAILRRVIADDVLVTSGSAITEGREP